MRSGSEVGSAVLVGLLVVLSYLMVLMLARPYKNSSVNMIAIGAQVLLVAVFLSSQLLKATSLCSPVAPVSSAPISPASHRSQVTLM